MEAGISGKNREIIYSFEEETSITSVDISGITLPVTGETPDLDFILPEDANYHFVMPDEYSYSYDFTNGVRWKRTSDDFLIESTDTFENDVEYYFSAMLIPNAGYTFSDNVNVTLNGREDYLFTSRVLDNVMLIHSKDFTATDTPESTYADVTGTFTSFGDTTKETTIQLILQGYSEASYDTAPTGNSGTYTISGVAPGTYTLKVMKAKHCAREYTVTVGSSNVTQNVEIRLYGDIYKDGKINNVDALQIQRHANKKASIFNSIP